MLGYLRRHAVECVALFVALGGTAYAATALPANSVTTVQVKNHSLVTADVKAGQVANGKRGLRGPAGAPGAAGAPLPVSTATGPDATLNPLGGACCALNISIASCPAGQYEVAGGWAETATGALVDATVIDTVRISNASVRGWAVEAINRNTAVAQAFKTVAVCVPSG